MTTTWGASRSWRPRWRWTSTVRRRSRRRWTCWARPISGCSCSPRQISNDSYSRTVVWCSRLRHQPPRYSSREPWQRSRKRTPGVSSMPSANFTRTIPWCRRYRAPVNSHKLLRRSFRTSVPDSSRPRTVSKRRRRFRIRSFSQVSLCNPCCHL